MIQDMAIVTIECE